MPKRAISLPRVRVRSFEPDANVVFNQFSCGEPAIDRWLKNKAKKCCKRFECRVFIAREPQFSFPIGFYALKVGSESVGEEVRSHDTYVKNYSAFPAISMSYLGVHGECQSQGLGRFLMMNALERVAEVSDHVGFYALTLQAIDGEVAEFYRQIGFEAYGGGAEAPKMLMPIDTVLELVRG